MSDKSSCHSLFADLDDSDALKAPPCYTARTGDVTVSVRTFWLEEHSDPEEQRYTWVYHVIIENSGEDSLQLLSRSWTILDATGKVDYVNGPGVMGEQPVISAKGRYEYTSGAELKTPTGFMQGLYHMLSPKTGERFDATVPTFSLDSPHHSGMIH
ncbi:Co2+/Mg2+ efflux protein ApaG [Saccharibacter sp. 17.LH.SD]|uniref:Co2+/Mg2+ efflux protein ApaG n=1 Tax=Saccharibacter sp. 17.LH.SD TaxID=2689393 RepID=UPI0013685642|nr:Co2+/Mg2+ efflux protein ApaG [Saccharibacter sp. 17.LH.SD]MXV43967.1 Co2+/Mg2+ efflux protein ApaG [Saccharibacter sp. 17.LH.SD]